MARVPHWRAVALFAEAVRCAGCPSPLRAHHGAARCPDPEARALLEENTEVTCGGSLTPEIRLRLLTPKCRLWRERAELWPHTDPYWAIYWPGGQALSRYILDHPAAAKGRSVLDLGSGCGAAAIAAHVSGARHVLANDTDPLAGTAIALNCELNGLSPLPICTRDILGSEPAPWDLVLLGDMFYDDELADRLQQWLKSLVQAHGTRVLIGDPGRPQLSGHSIQGQLCKVTEYPLPESIQQENYGLTVATVWELQP